MASALGCVGRLHAAQNLNTDLAALEKALSDDEQNRSIAADELRKRESIVIDLLRYARL